MPYHPSLSSRAIIGDFYRRLEGAFNASWASRLGMLFQSNQESETYNWLGQVPQMREWGTGRLVKQLRADGITLTNQLYEATLRIDIDDMRRDKTGQINVRIAELAKRAAMHWEKLLSALIEAGIAATLGLAYDGQYFYDSDHSEGSSGTQLNLLTATQVTQLDVGTATAPTEAEMAKAILGVIGYMLSYKDDQGEPINGDVRSFLVMVGNANLYGPTMAACIEKQLEAGSGAVQPNVLRSSGFSLECILNPFMTAASWTDDFFIFRTDGDVRPFILQEEQAVKVDAIAEGSEMEINERQHQYGVTAQRAVGYGMWQHAALATLS